LTISSWPIPSGKNPCRDFDDAAEQAQPTFVYDQTSDADAAVATSVANPETFWSLPRANPNSRGGRIALTGSS
jgi:hypothetical protein